MNSIVKANAYTIEDEDTESFEIEPEVPAVFNAEGFEIVPKKLAVYEQRITKPAVTEEFLGIAESNMIAILTKAIQEQQVMIDQLRTDFESYKASHP